MPLAGFQIPNEVDALNGWQAEIDDGITWTVLDRTATFATTSTTTKLAISSTGFKDSGWLKLAPEARADNALIRVFGTASNSTGDPVISASLAFR